MDVVTIHFRTTPAEFPLAAVIESILKSFDGARITQEDWYADARRQAERTIELCEKAGRPMTYPERILNDIDSAALSIGPRKILAIPIAKGGSLKGDITRHGLTLFTDVSLENNQTVSAIVDLLTSMNIVASVETNA